jgi:hypothetical protein
VIIERAGHHEVPQTRTGLDLSDQASSIFLPGNLVRLG